MRVDIAKMLRDRGLGWLPGFVVRYLRRVLHEGEVNSYLEDYAHLPTMEFVRATLARMEIKYRAVGMERLDPAGRYIFASNHPFGGLDGLMLADEASRYFGDVRVVVNDLLMNLTPLRPIFVPVNKHGRQSARYAQAYNDAFASSLPIITFPAGLCSRRRRGVVCDLEWRHSFVRQAITSQRDIVPVFFDGRLSDFFYRLSNIRTLLGVRANIEMLYLADEMFRQRGSTFEIRIGEPVPWQTLKTSNPREAAARIKAKVYTL